jgi:inner membrane protein|tara:strand:+ start:724 stop:1725 length:1002 start_codon:yes stop_codon:yes gene_type:complete
MDPLSQGVIGASLAQTVVTNKKYLMSAGIIGFLSGIAPDIDVLIRSEQDPLLFLEYHRQFTHSLVFVPFGGLFCATILFYIFRLKKKLTFLQVWIFATLGYGTHGLLDACTSYGTLLFWPFSYDRISWNNISIIDPLFTLPILILILMGIFFKKIILARLALIWALLYLTMGVVQHNNAKEIAKELASKRGHSIARIQVKPTIGNIFLWKSIYESNGYFYTDGIGLYPIQKIHEGEKTKKLNIDEDFSWLNKESQQAKDIKRFEWFSSGYIAVSKNNPNHIIDIRYSMLPNEIAGLWGIELKMNAGKEEHINYITNRSLSRSKLNELWELFKN